MPKLVTVPCSVGEFFDKLSILKIKEEYFIKFDQPEKLKKVEREIAALYAVGSDHDLKPQTFYELPEYQELLAVNRKLWAIEELIRDCEKKEDFGSQFIQLARAVYQTNDERARIKGRINVVFESEIIETKSYV